MENKPRIRFKGFTEDWEQRKLNDFGIATGGTSIESEFVDEGAYKVISIGSYSEESVYNDQGLRVNKTGKTKSRILNKDDLTMILNDKTSSGNIIGRVLLIDQDNTYVYNQRTERIEVDTKNFLPMFLYHMLNAPEQRKYIVKASQGNTQIYVNWSTISNINYMIPTLPAEQEKIAYLFSLINKDITLHQCKLEKLKLTKKSLLQKLFPKNGKRIPEIRFKGFTDAWEQRKFSDITYLSGIKNKENKPYESYSISNEFGFIPQDEQFENGGTMKTADKSMYYIVSQNSFAYNPARINVGSIGYYDKPNNVIVSSLYEVFKTIDIVNDKFLWHWFKSNQFNRLIEKYQEGGVRLYFYYDKLCKGTIDLPTINEQNKISNLLDRLDLYITLHQRKLDHLQLQKKALLQQMFV